MKLHGNMRLFSLYIDGELDKKLKDSVALHIETCDECRKTVEMLKGTRDLLSRTGRIQAPADLARDIMDNIPETKPSALPVKKFYLPVFGTIALLIAAFLVMHNRTQEIQIARAPVHERPPETAKGAAIPELQQEKRPVDEVKRKNEEETVSQPGAYHKPFALKEKGTSLEKPVDRLSDTSRAREGTKVIAREEGTGKALAGAASAPSSSLKTEGQYCIIGEGGKKVCSSASSVSDEVSGTETAKITEARPLPNAMVIRDKKEWSSIWNTQNTLQNLTLPLPDVDFKEKMVVAVPSRQADNEYTVVNTIEEKDKIVVQYKELPLQKLAPPPYQLNVVNKKPSVEFQKID